MESMLKIISESLKDADVEKVTKAELREQYLKKTGITKLSKEDKKLFSSAVNTAYLSFVSPVCKIDDSSNINITTDSDDEIPSEPVKNGNAKNGSRQSVKRPLTISSDDDFSEKMQNEKIIQNKIQKKKRSRYSSDKDNYIKNTNSDSEDEPVISFTKNRPNSYKKSKSNSSPSENEPLTKYSKEKSKPHKVMENNSSESEDEPLTKYSKGKSKPCQVKKGNSSESDEPLVKYSKGKSKPFKGKESNSGESDEPLSKYSKGNSNPCKVTVSNSSESDEPLTKYSKRKSKPCKVEKSNSSESEDEPLTKYSKKKSKTSKVTESNSSESDEPLTKYSKGKSKPFKVTESNSSESADVPLTKNSRRSSSLKKGTGSNTTESEDEPLTKSSKKKSRNLIDIEDASVITSAKKKSNNLNESLKNNSSESENKSVIIFAKNENSPKIDDIVMYDEKDSSFSKVKPLKNFISSSDSDSENQPVITSNKKKKNSSNPSENIVSDSENVPMEKFMKNKVKNSPKIDIITTLQNTKKLNASKVESTSDSENDGISKNKISDSEDEPLKKYSKKKLNDSIDSEDEPMTSIIKRKSGSFNESTKSSSSDSEDEPLTKKKSRNTIDSDDDFEIPKTKKKSSLLKRSPRVTINISDSDDEPLTKFTDRKPDNSKNSENKSEEILIKKERSTKIDDISILNGLDESNENSLSKKKKHINSDGIKYQKEKKIKNMEVKLPSATTDSSEDEPLSKFAENKPKDSSDSEEPWSTLRTAGFKNKPKRLERSSSVSPDENDVLVEEETKNMKFKKKQGNNSEKKKHSSASEKKIEHLKKYVRAAGIRVKCYTKLFENCKSAKAKCEKLLHLLEKEGLKGRPTLEKCRKLKKKIETKKEISELDVSNILKTKGRSKRAVCLDATNLKMKSASASPAKGFSRLKGIVDSEESD